MLLEVYKSLGSNFEPTINVGGVKHAHSSKADHEIPASPSDKKELKRKVNNSRSDLSFSLKSYSYNKSLKFTEEMSCEVEVAAVSPAMPPPTTTCDETAVAEGSPTEPTPTSTYGWLCTLPMATSAGNAVSNLYDASKNYNCVTQYAMGTVEGSVMKAASVVSPVVHKLDGPSKLYCCLLINIMY